MNNGPEQDRPVVARRASDTNCYCGLFILFLVIAMMFFGSAASAKDQTMKTAAFVAGCMSLFLTVAFIICARDRKHQFTHRRGHNARLIAAGEAAAERQGEENPVEDNEEQPAELESDEQGASEENEHRSFQQVEQSVNESLRSRRVAGSLNDLHDSLRTERSMLPRLRVTGSVDELLAARRGNESGDSEVTKAIDELLALRQANHSADSATAESGDKELSELAANHEDQQNHSPEVAEGFDESFKFTSTPHKAEEFEMTRLEKRKEDEEDKV